MKKYLKYLIILIFSTLFIFSFIKPVIAEDNNVVVEFYFSEDCDHCQDKYDEIEEIEQIYGANITVKRLSLSINENLEEFYDYEFKVPPGVVVLNQSNGKFNVFPYEKITIAKLAEHLGCSTRTVHRNMGVELKKEKQLLNQEI